jgi:uncharacterized phage protein (TIGR01671 family)
MNESYLFRGKQPHNKKWVYGFYSWHDTITVDKGMDSETGYADYAECTIDKATLGQCTNFGDKHGIGVYDGDIILAEIKGVRAKVIVEFYHGTWAFIYGGDGDVVDYNPLFDLNSNEVEIIGNIYDNPELLEVQNDR